MKRPVGAGARLRRRSCGSAASGRCFCRSSWWSSLPGLHLIYPWARDDAPSRRMSRSSFSTRRPSRPAGSSRSSAGRSSASCLPADRLDLLGASLALVFHGVAISVVAVVWMLSLDPRFTNSAFGAENWPCSRSCWRWRWSRCAHAGARHRARKRRHWRRCCSRRRSALSTLPR